MTKAFKQLITKTASIFSHFLSPFEKMSFQRHQTTSSPELLSTREKIVWSLSHLTLLESTGILILQLLAAQLMRW